MNEQIHLQKLLIDMVLRSAVDGGLRDTLPVISPTDAALMLAIKELDKGKGVPGFQIQQWLNEKHKDFMAKGTVYTTLSRLQDKGLLTSFGLLEDDPHPGHPKVYFKVTPDGDTALNLMEIWMRRRKA